MRRSRFALTLASLALLGAAPAHAALDPVVFYDASGYTEAIPLDSTIEDQSTANHDARVRFDAVGISTDVPAGFSGKSFDLTGIGMFDTFDDLLLANADVAAAGGYVMEAWVKADLPGTNTAKIIDYAGTERISLAGSTSGDASIGPLGNRTHIEMRMSNTTYRVGGREPIELDNNWHYALAEFVVTDALTDPTHIKGVMRLTIDGQADVNPNGGKTTFGDNIQNAATGESGAKIAVGTRSTVSITNPGGSGDNLEGLVFQPKVWLGTIAEPVRLRINTTTGEASFRLAADATIPGATRFGFRIDSYSIGSPDGALLTANWNSLDDQNLDPNPGSGEDGRFDDDDDADGHDFLLWQQQIVDAGALPHTGANATADAKVNFIDLNIWKSKFGSSPEWREETSSADGISESHGTHGTNVTTASPVSIGNIFDTTKPQNLTFTYSMDGDPTIRTGIIEYAAGAAAVPEPSSVILATAALVGGAVLRRRRR